MERSTPRPRIPPCGRIRIMWIIPLFPRLTRHICTSGASRSHPYASTIMADYASGVNMYSVFLHGDQPLTEIQTENKNGRKAVVVKESFGNAFSPFLWHTTKPYIL